MADIIIWPRDGLIPKRVAVNQRPFTRSGGRTLQGLERNILSDLGYLVLSATFDIQSLFDTDRQRTWNSLRTAAKGKSGTLAFPAREFPTAPYPIVGGGRLLPGAPLPDSDGTFFSDDSGYMTRLIDVEMAVAADIGDEVVSLLSNASDSLAGTRFSYNHALYETGPYISRSGGVWTMPIFPAIRAPIAAGEKLEFDYPTCLVHLASDSAMDYERLAGNELTSPVVELVEAVDYWNDLAA
jgi:hypothetical protein